MSTPTKRRLEASRTIARPASTAGGGEPAGLDEPDVGQPVELDGQLGPGQVDGVAELGARDRPDVAQQVQQVRLVGVLRPDRHSLHRAVRLL